MKITERRGITKISKEEKDRNMKKIESRIYKSEDSSDDNDNDNNNQ